MAASSKRVVGDKTKQFSATEVLEMVMEEGIDIEEDLFEELDESDGDSDDLAIKTVLIIVECCGVPVFKKVFLRSLCLHIFI